MSLRGRDQTKAGRYIQQLDEARCQGKWEAVPDLLRKIKKHAPARNCLVLTAEAEHAIAQASHVGSAVSRPSTAKSTTSSSTSELKKYIPQLLEAIEKERIHVEDEFQAQVCLGWLYWRLEEYHSAISQLPKSVEHEFSQLDGTNKESGEWTRVCALKAAYLKGSSQVKIGASVEALETYESTLPVFTIISAKRNYGLELKIWTELYLTGFCILSSGINKSRTSPVIETETLAAFRGWAAFWDGQASVPSGGRAPFSPVPRRHVWKEYYLVLSDILQHELPFATTSLIPTNTVHSTRIQQRLELQRVEARYESLLLSEVQFPRAEEVNEEVETFVNIATKNWGVLCGNGWNDHDIGEGGAEGVSRGILDILYRAGTKTFHSTPILRHLFKVHLAVADFDLAFKAFDTYMEIVKRGKARVEKTGDPEPGLDDDETVLDTASECIKALCQYGSREGAEKAKDLSHFFEVWLDKHYPLPQDSAHSLENGASAKPIDPNVLTRAWRCIGIGYANWARFTFDGSSRGDIQQQAIKCFRRALHPSYRNSANIETLFALGTVLAERREVPVAIEVVKSGLLPSRKLSTKPSGVQLSHHGGFTKERALIPLWHLMALLLSARHEFVTAARSCEGAFEQFQDPKNLFGDADLGAHYRSEHLQINEKFSPKILGVVDEMNDIEKESVLEVKMTQLALVEIIEGAEVAVNASDELLGLYTRLFGDPLQDESVPTNHGTNAEPPPKSSASTLRSIKGSIFGRSGRPAQKSQTAPALGERSAVSLRPQTTQTIPAPMIQVTSANGRPATQHHHFVKEPPSEKHKPRSGSLSNKKTTRDRSASTGRRSNPASQHRVTTLDGEEYFTPMGDDQHEKHWFHDESTKSEVSESIDNHPSSDHHTSAPDPLPPQSQQMPQKEKSLQPANPDPIKNQDHRLPQVSPHSLSTSPRMRFPKDQERRRRISTLVKVWLLISSFYRRAAMYEDSKGAIEEAQKLVKILDEDITKDLSGKVSLTDSGWGGGKSVSELWGDVHAESGYLALAESLPYQALAQFEAALTEFQDHPSAIVGLSNILLDIYSGDLLPPPSITPLILPPTGPHTTPSSSAIATPVSGTPATQPGSPGTLSSSQASQSAHGPLGISLPGSTKSNIPRSIPPTSEPNKNEPGTALQDRIAARDRAAFLLSTLTKLGKGWNYSEAWFALARAYELQGQQEKAKEVLWWCVELEEGKAVRDWSEIGRGGYVL
ncbi:hypothetical protein B0O99DRAFT_684226 [Bisporella sp. PMI_857]|nr:hypothetical protein B0O99DRAFT_684226 [Bisporella sp. PMI_857]